MSEYLIVKIGDTYSCYQPNGVIIKRLQEISKITGIELDESLEKAINELHERVKESIKIKNPSACKQCGVIFDNYTGKMKYCCTSCARKMNNPNKMKNQN